MVSLIVSENSSFTNSVLAEFHRKTKVLQLRKSIVQPFKELCFNLSSDSKVIINNADAIAGDEYDTKFSVLDPLFKKYLDLAASSYKEVGISTYFNNFVLSIIHKHFDDKLSALLNRNINLCLVDFSNKEELEAVLKGPLKEGGRSLYSLRYPPV